MAGNIAGEDLAFRETLIANGAVRPLTQLVARAAKALSDTSRAVDDDAPLLAAATTAAWALSNTLKGAGPEVGRRAGMGLPLDLWVAVVWLEAAGPCLAPCQTTVAVISGRPCRSITSSV